MARLDEGDIHVLDTVARNVDRAVAGIEDRLRRLEAALAEGLTVANRGVAELWRELQANGTPVVVVEESTDVDNPKPGEQDTETVEAAVVAETRDRDASPQRRHVVIGGDATPRTIRHRLI